MPTTNLDGRASYNLDRDLRFLSASDLVLALWGKSRAEILGRRLTDVFPHAAGSEAFEAHLQALRSFQPFRGRVLSPMLGAEIDLEIYPSADGLRVSFALVTSPAGRGQGRPAP